MFKAIKTEFKELPERLIKLSNNERVVVLVKLMTDVLAKVKTNLQEIPEPMIIRFKSSDEV